MVWLSSEECLCGGSGGSMANIAGSLALGIDIGADSVTAAAMHGCKIWGAELLT